MAITRRDAPADLSRSPRPPRSSPSRPRRVRRYIAAGELDAVRLGRRTIRIKVESLDRLIDAHPVNTWRGRSA